MLAARRTAMFSEPYGGEARGLFARMPGKPSRAQKRIYADHIATLVSKGLWAKLDLYFVPAGHDQQGSLLNWRQPAYDLTVSGSPTFTAGRGWKGNGTDGRLVATGYNPSTVAGNLVLNSATVGAYIRTAATAGTGQDIAGGSMRLFRGASTYGYRLHDSTDGTVSPAGYTGHFAARRTASNERSIWRNASSLSSTSTASTSVMSSFNILANAGGAVFSDAEISVAYAGSAFTDQQMADMDTAIAALKAALGF